MIMRKTVWPKKDISLTTTLVADEDKVEKFFLVSRPLPRRVEKNIEFGENNNDTLPLAGGKFNVAFYKQKYKNLGKDVKAKSELVKKIMRSWEVTDDEFNAVGWRDPISDKILLSAARGTVVQWAPTCYSTQSRVSKANAKSGHDCSCIRKLLKKGTFEPPDYICRGFVDAYKIIERDNALKFRSVMNRIKPKERKRKIEKMKKCAKDEDREPPGWSTNEKCEDYLVQYGPAEYNKLVKAWNGKSGDDREEASLPKEGLYP
jgi:hypothetical protein